MQGVKTPRFPIDDAWLGVLAMPQGFGPKRDARFKNYKKQCNVTKEPCSHHDVATCHGYEKSPLLDAWGKFLRDREGCRLRQRTRYIAESQGQKVDPVSESIADAIKKKMEKNGELPEPVGETPERLVGNPALANSEAHLAWNSNRRNWPFTDYGKFWQESCQKVHRNMADFNRCSRKKSRSVLPPYNLDCVKFCQILPKNLC